MNIDSSMFYLREKPITISKKKVNRFLIYRTISPNEWLWYVLIESYVVMGSMVPIASLLMIRLQLNDEALDKSCFRVKSPKFLFTKGSLFI